MAAKEKKLTITKNLKDNLPEKDKLIDQPKTKRGRKPVLPVNDNKSILEGKNSQNLAKRKRRKNNAEDGQISASVQKRARRSVLDQEDSSLPKTPPPNSQKLKKTHLEKELGDLLENATGRNTPSLPRNKKAGEKEEEAGEDLDDRGVLLFSKAKKMVEKEPDDDTVSVKSFSTLLRTRKFAEKEIDDDTMSVRSMNGRTKKIDMNNDDASSVKNLIRPNIMTKTSRKKKRVLTAIAIKKKIFIRRGRPKKGKEVNEIKTKHLEEKRVARIKAADKNLTETKQKRIIKKPLKFQSKIKDQNRLRPTLAIKNQKLKKAKLKLSDKNSRQILKGEAEAPKEAAAEQALKERLKADSQTLIIGDAETPKASHASSDSTLKKRKVATRKRKSKKDDPDFDGNSEKSADIYFFTEGEAAVGHGSSSKGKSGKAIKLNQSKPKAGKKKNTEQKKQRRETGIHFETTRSPDDSSVIIVQPRLGPKIKTTKRLKPILPKTEEISKRGKSLPKDMVPANVLPKTLAVTGSNFNQISSSYFVQSIPNFNVFAANSAIIRSYNSNATVNTNFDGSVPITGELPFADESEYSFRPKVSSNEIIVTPSGIVLSGSRIISSTNQNSSTVCFNGSNSNFVPDSSFKDVVFPPRAEAVENVQSPGLIYQSSTTVIQPQSCPNSKTIFLKRPETMSTSLISTAAGALLINPNVTANGGIRVTNVKPHSGCNSSTDTKASEEALEGDFHASGETSAANRFKNISKIDFIPSIPVAKNVSDLIMLKNRSTAKSLRVEKTFKRNDSESYCNSSDKNNSIASKVLRKSVPVSGKEKVKVNKSGERKIRKRTLKNVRHAHDSGSELTFSEPETSYCENDISGLFKTISYERLNKEVSLREENPNVLLQLGSEPITISETLVPYETTSMLLTAKKENLEAKLEKDGEKGKEASPKIKGAVDVCKFSKENEEALKEFGLDSDLDQTKSEHDTDSPLKTKKTEDAKETSENKAVEIMEITSTTKIKEETDNVLKEMPIRKIPNFFRKSNSFQTSAYRVEFKPPLIHKSADYLSLSPSKPPTVIDKLLEKNKSLKKAEQEGKFQNSLHNFSGNAVDYDMMEMRSRRSLREAKSKKFARGMDSRKVAHKKFMHGSSSSAIYERRGSNPEIYSDNFLTIKKQVANENVPLSQVTDSGDNFSRRGSIDYESVQKVLDRRCSLPVSGDNLADPKLSKSMEDVNKIKTENIKTVVVGSARPLTNKNRGPEVQPRVINIITSNCGMKKGKNLMEEVGLETGSSEVSFVNGDKCNRRISVESSNSESENLHKLMDGLMDISTSQRLSDEVPYFGEENSKAMEKMRLGLDRKTLDDKNKKNEVVEESPEDLVTKETILSALGLQSLKAAAQSAQKRKENLSHQNSCQADNGKYTGTLKTVIKIQRQEKKGSSKSPIKMVYKASSSSSVGGRIEESGNFEEAEAGSVEDVEEAASEDNKNGNGKAKSLVIPEKASSFSIHPGRLCSDVCTYCFGKFGLLDTPCHIAQLKDADKRRNILAAEAHLTADSCLCDACFRHVDKKSNCPSFTDKKNDIRRRSVRKQSCVVQNCNADSQHSIRRKLFLKLKKSIGRKVVLDAGKLEKLQPGQSLTFCNRHIYWIDYFMSCGICKKRLTRYGCPCGPYNNQFHFWNCPKKEGDDELETGL